MVSVDGEGEMSPLQPKNVGGGRGIPAMFPWGSPPPRQPSQLHQAPPKIFDKRALGSWHLLGGPVTIATTWLVVDFLRGH